MIRTLFGIYHPTHKLALLVIDLLSIFVAFSAASFLRLKKAPEYFSLEFLGISLIIILCVFLANGYASEDKQTSKSGLLRVFLVIAGSSIPGTVFIYWLGPDRFNFVFGRGIFPLSILIAGLLSIALRSVVNHFMIDNSRSKRVLVFTDTESYELLNKENSFRPSNLALELCSDWSRINTSTPNKEVIVISQRHRLDKSKQELLVNARTRGVLIYSFEDFFEKFYSSVPVAQIDDDWLIWSGGFTVLQGYAAIRIKRFCDICFSSALLFISIPILVISGLLIKSTSAGPVFFSQKRIGLNGRVFQIYKLRTMRVNAECGEAKWASENDDRVIRFGRILRKTRIDEIPQCWNILKGEMSFIGPRPERPEFIGLLRKDIPYYDLRHLVKPGLTGWAQVNYPYGASVEDALKKLQYDLYYIKHYSLILDLNILLSTVLVSLNRKGR